MPGSVAASRPAGGPKQGSGVAAGFSLTEVGPKPPLDLHDDMSDLSEDDALNQDQV